MSATEDLPDLSMKVSRNLHAVTNPFLSARTHSAERGLTSRAIIAEPNEAATARQTRYCIMLACDGEAPRDCKPITERRGLGQGSYRHLILPSHSPSMLPSSLYCFVASKGLHHSMKLRALVFGAFDLCAASINGLLRSNTSASRPTCRDGRSSDRRSLRSRARGTFERTALIRNRLAFALLSRRVTY